jgi:hypothetical protein
MKERSRAEETDEERAQRDVRRMFPDYARDYADIATVWLNVGCLLCVTTPKKLFFLVAGSRSIDTIRSVDCNKRHR